MKWWQYKKQWLKRLETTLVLFPFSILNIIVIYTIPYDLHYPERKCKYNLYTVQFEKWVQVALQWEYEFFYEAAKEGHTSAMARLSSYCVDQGQNEAGYDWARLSAATSDPRGQAMLALCYALGCSTQCNFEKARKFIEIAYKESRRQDSFVLFILGLTFFCLNEVPKGKLFLREAIALGNQPLAVVALGTQLLFNEKNKIGMKLLKKATKNVSMNLTTGKLLWRFLCSRIFSFDGHPSYRSILHPCEKKKYENMLYLTFLCGTPIIRQRIIENKDYIQQYSILNMDRILYLHSSLFFIQKKTTESYKFFDIYMKEYSILQNLFSTVSFCK